MEKLVLKIFFLGAFNLPEEKEEIAVREFNFEFTLKPKSFFTFWLRLIFSFLISAILETKGNVINIANINVKIDFIIVSFYL